MGPGGQPDELRLKIQALADNELSESEIPEVLEAIQGSYEYREEYAKLLQLKRKLSDQPAVSIPDGWLEKAERRIGRRIGRGAGIVLLLGSYAALIGYAVYTLFRDPDVPFVLAVLVASLVGGVVFLLANAIGDRIRERKDDKYRGVVR